MEHPFEIFLKQKKKKKKKLIGIHSPTFKTS